MPIPSVQKVNEFDQNLDSSEEFVNSTSETFTTHTGLTRETITGVINNAVQRPIEPFSELAPYPDNSKWVEYPASGGAIYRPKPSALPIAAGAFDSGDWVLAQPSDYVRTLPSISDLRSSLGSVFYSAGVIVSIASVGYTARTYTYTIFQGDAVDDGVNVITENGGTVTGSQFFAIRSGFIVKDNNQGDQTDPESFGAVYGAGQSQSVQEANTVSLQSAINTGKEVKIRGLLETYGRVYVPDRTKIKGSAALGIGIWGKHPTENTIECVEIYNGTTGSTQGVVITGLSILSDNANAIKCCPYQWVIRDCRFQSPNGIGIWPVGNSLIWNNVIENNVFFGYTYGIYTSNSDTRGFTDNDVLHNKFDGDSGNEISAIDVGRPAGTRFSGNHYWKNHTREFLVARGGSNCRIGEEYYEDNGSGSARIRIEGGNPSGHVISNCSFWLGDGTRTDWEGDPSSLIVFSVNSFNQNTVTVEGSNFLGGTNAMPVFKILNAPASSQIQNARISFSRSNTFTSVVNYSLLTYNATSTGSGWIFDTDHPVFKKVETSNSSFDIVFKDWSELVWLPSAPTTNITSIIPGDWQVTLGRRVRLCNLSGSYTWTLSSSGVSTISGLNPIPANTSVYIEWDGATGYLISPT